MWGRREGGGVREGARGGRREGRGGREGARGRRGEGGGEREAARGRRREGGGEREGDVEVDLCTQQTLGDLWSSVIEGVAR